MTTTRMGRKTCIHCRKSLDNGEPLTDATVEVTERWSTNSVGFTRVPVAPYNALVAAHAACYDDSVRWVIESKLRYAREQLAELDEYIAEREGGASTRLNETRDRWITEIAELEGSLR